MIKFCFSIKNVKPAPTEYNIPIFECSILGNRALHDYYFNDFVFFSLRDDISKRIISNGMNVSSWTFSKFMYLNPNFMKENPTLI